MPVSLNKGVPSIEVTGLDVPKERFQVCFPELVCSVPIRPLLFLKHVGFVPREYPATEGQL